MLCGKLAQDASRRVNVCHQVTVAPLPCYTLLCLAMPCYALLYSVVLHKIDCTLIYSTPLCSTFQYLSLLTVLHCTLPLIVILILILVLIRILQPFSHYLLSFILLTTLPLFSLSFQENVRLKKEIEHEKALREKVEMNFTAVSDVAKNLQEAENILQNKLSKTMQVSELFIYVLILLFCCVVT